MTTNLQNTRPSSRPGDPPVVETTTTPVVSPTGVGGVAVFERDINTPHPTATRIDDHGPVEARSTGSILSWIIGAIVLIVLAYFLLQILF